MQVFPAAANLSGTVPDKPSEPAPHSNPAQNNPELISKSRELEAAFLSEMLKAAGVGKPLATFGGGAGEDAFAGFLVNEYATLMVDRGGIGLSEAIVRALAEDAR